MASLQRLECHLCYDLAPTVWCRHVTPAKHCVGLIYCGACVLQLKRAIPTMQFKLVLCDLTTLEEPAIVSDDRRVRNDLEAQHLG